jgi:hypothetical protein
MTEFSLLLENKEMPKVSTNGGDYKLNVENGNFVIRL